MSDREPDGWPLWARSWILPYFEDSALWPVLIAILGHVLVLIVPLLAFAYRSRNPVSYVFIAALVFVTGQLAWVEFRAVGRPGAITGVVAVLWASSIPLAWYTGKIGIF